ncbi:MAG: cation diffusion facilitator family transporter [Candidatus Saccharibacteria bacterium]|nr:cation diffusion facilitator family transporter [Candidatus Saccharibacteria bacterium]
MNRMKRVIKTSLVGVLTNLILVAFKAFVGLVSGSISIISDALNNLSDAISSIVTIVGMLLAGKKPDKKHPYGYGKIEHVSALTVGIIILGTGISLLVESAQKIIEPELAKFDIPMLIIITAGIFVKFLLGRFTKKRGEELNSDSLVASGSDALFDVLISTATLVGALITFIFNITIDGWLGLIISALVIKTAVEIIMDSVSSIIGERVDSDLSFKIKKAVSRNKEVLGAYDLTLHQYGPERIIGSIHIEVEDKLTAREIHLLTRKISEQIFEKFGVILTIGIYATNTEKTEYAEIKQKIEKLIKKYPSILQMHGYYVDSEKKLISFDLVFDFKEKETSKLIEEIREKIAEEYPKYTVNIVLDTDFSD